MKRSQTVNTTEDKDVTLDLSGDKAANTLLTQTHTHTLPIHQNRHSAVSVSGEQEEITLAGDIQTQRSYL